MLYCPWNSNYLLFYGLFSCVLCILAVENLEKFLLVTLFFVPLHADYYQGYPLVYPNLRVNSPFPLAWTGGL